jgi:hypothetical protein
MAILEVIKTNDLDETSVADSYVVNRGGETYKIPVEESARQFLSDGPLATAIRNAAQGYITTLTWDDLVVLVGARQGQAARVSDLDGGHHLDPLTGEQRPNAGEYAWNTFVGGWIWLATNKVSPVILAQNTGEGTPSAIIATAAQAVSDGALVALPVVDDVSQAPITVTFNGGPLLTIKTNAGGNLSSLAGGQVAVGFVEGNTFRMVVDGVPAGLLEEIEEVRQAAEDAVQTAQELVAKAETALQPGAAMSQIDGLVEALGGKATVDQVGQAIDALGLGSAATRNVGVAANTVAAGDDSRIVSAVQPGSSPLLGGITISRSGAGQTLLFINGDVGQPKRINFASGGADRWRVQATASDDLEVVRVSDAGISNVALSVSRNTGAVNFLARPTVAGAQVALLSDIATGAYKGVWNANTNSPTITGGSGVNGDFYVVGVVGTQSVTGSSTAFSIGDQVRFNGTAWQRIPNASAVSSVAGRTGAVALTNNDISGLGTAAPKNTGRSIGDILSYENFGDLPTLNTDQRIIIRKPTPTANDYAHLHIVRDANYTGGAARDVNGALVVFGTARAGVNNFEWPLQSILENYSPYGENVASTGIARARSGAGPTWAGQFSTEDYDANPSPGRVGTEINIAANGGDANRRRIILHVATSALNKAGLQPLVGTGVSIGTNPEGVGARIDRGIDVNGLVNVGLALTETGIVGIDTTLANLSSNAIRIKTNQTIALEQTGAITISFNGTHVQIKNGNSVLAQWAA